MMKNQKKFTNEFLKQVGETKAPSWKDFHSAFATPEEKLYVAILFPEKRQYLFYAYLACMEAYILKFRRMHNIVTNAKYKFMYSEFLKDADEKIKEAKETVVC